MAYEHAGLRAPQILHLLLCVSFSDVPAPVQDTLDIPDSAMPMGGAMMMATAPAPAAAAETEEEPAEEKTEFDVKLEASVVLILVYFLVSCLDVLTVSRFDSSKKIALIKEVRAATSLGLKEVSSRLCFVVHTRGGTIDTFHI